MMSHRILNVNVSLQSINQPQLCEQMLDAMTRDDRDSLLVVTSTQRVSISSKLLQIFSPFYRSILEDIPSRDGDPVTVIIPDTEAVHIRHLMDLLASGRSKKMNKIGSRGSLRDIVNLAECIKIELREADLTAPLEDVGQKPPPRIKVKNLQDMISSPSFKSPNAEKASKPNSYNFPNRIIFDDDKVVEGDAAAAGAPARGTGGGSDPLRFGYGVSGTGACNSQILGGEKCGQCTVLKRCNVSKLKTRNHEQKVRRSAHLPITYKCLPCGIKYINQQSLFNHLRMKHFPNLPLFHCSFCDSRFSTQLPLKKHISKLHKKSGRPVKLSYKFSEVEGPPSCFFETI